MRSFASDHRTPLAWRNRDITLQTPSTRSNNNHMHSHHRAPPTPSETTSTSGDEREEVPMVRTPHGHHHNHHNHHRGHDILHHHNHRRSNSRNRNSSYQQHSPYTSNGEGPYRNHGGTLRSTRSVPALALATWDGEPCPVHGHGVPLYPPHPHLHGPSNGTLRRHGSLFDIRGGGPFYPPPPPHHVFMGHHHPQPPPLLDKKSFHGSLQMLPSSPLPPYLLPPLMRPRPFVYPVGVEPLPVRDPFKGNRMAPSPHSVYAGSKGDDSYTVDQVCCKGHLIVLWIILAVVTIGVVLGIVLGVTIA